MKQSCRRREQAPSCILTLADAQTHHTCVAFGHFPSPSELLLLTDWTLQGVLLIVLPSPAKFTTEALLEHLVHKLHNWIQQRRAVRAKDHCQSRGEEQDHSMLFYLFPDLTKTYTCSSRPLLYNIHKTDLILNLASEMHLRHRSYIISSHLTGKRKIITSQTSPTVQLQLAQPFILLQHIYMYIVFT